jgi:flagellar motor switch protein FliN/FliY
MADQPTQPDPDAEEAVPEQPAEPEATAADGAADAAATPADTPEPAEAQPTAQADAPDARTDGGPASEEPTGAAPAEGVKNTFDQAELDALAAEAAALNEATAEEAGQAEAAVESAAGDLAAEMAAAIASESGAGEELASGEREAAAQASAPSTGSGFSRQEGFAVLGDTPVDVSAEDAEAYHAPDLAGGAEGGDRASIDMLDDVQLDVKIELGRTNMYIEDVLRLAAGSVVELDKLAGDPVDVYVNERLIARGEVLVLNENFCIRINDIHSPIPELEGDE